MSPDSVSLVHAPARDAADLRRRAPARRDETADLRVLGTVVAATMLGLALRLAGLGHNSLWFDEAWTVWIARHSPADILALLRGGDAHPPLHFLLVHLWIAIAGKSEAAVRLPSACFGAATVPLTYALARRTGSRAAAPLGAFLVAASPFAVMAAQDARMYALLGMLAAGSTAMLAACVDAGGARRWTCYAALAVLMAYTHYFAALVLAAHGLWMAGWRRHRLVPWLLAMGGVAACLGPWGPALSQQLLHGNAWPWYRRAPVADVGDMLALLAFGGSLFGAGSYFFPGTLGSVGLTVALAPFLGIAAAGMFMPDGSRRLPLVALPPAIALLVCLVFPWGGLMVYPRWFSYLVPFFAVVAARGVTALATRFASRPRRLAVAAVVALLMSAPGALVSARYFFDPGFRPYPWRAAAALVEHEAQPGDYYLYTNTAAEVAFGYYVPEAGPGRVVFGPDGAGPALSAAEARALARAHRRVWLIATPPLTPAMQQALAASLADAFRVAGRRAYPGIWIHLLEPRPQAP